MSGGGFKFDPVSTTRDLCRKSPLQRHQHFQTPDWKFHSPDLISLPIRILRLCSQISKNCISTLDAQPPHVFSDWRCPRRSPEKMISHWNTSFSQVHLNR